MGNGADFGEFHLHLFNMFSISNQFQSRMFDSNSMCSATGMVLAQTITQINESHLSYHFQILYPYLEKSTTSNAIVARVVTLEQIDPLDESEIQKV